MAKQHKSMRGKAINMDALRIQHEQEIALGNMSVNARGDLLGPGGKGLLTISGGLASFPRDGSSTDELFKRADEALLEAKRSGKNRIYLVGGPDSDISKIH